VRRALIALVAVGAIGALQVSDVIAIKPSTDNCSPPPRVASSTRVTCPPDPNQAAYDQLKARLGGDIAKALDAQQRLTSLLDRYAGIEEALTNQVAQEEATIAALEDQIAKLDAEIQDTQDRIDVEKQQLAVMARAIYRQPDSFWVLIARSGNLHEALLATSDMVIAGQHAHALQAKLEADLAKLQTDRKARQDDLDRENANHDLLVANLSALQDVMSTQGDVSSQLADLVSQMQEAAAGLTNQPPDVTSALAQLLEAQEQDLIQRSYQTAWSQAQVGSGLALLNHQLPLGKTLHGLRLAWPMASFQITQAFGPSNVLLEPPLGRYKHFHAGVDIAAPLGTPVMAAADGVVVAVGHTRVGYGVYVILAHGGGIETLYGHLLDTKAKVGDHLARGQELGHEGSTGFSTGPHVHFELRVNDQVTDPMPYLPVPGTSWAG
jgi:murein DD-endopeptidase MepM/ murein hydrolase activator NlpD